MMGAERLPVESGRPAFRTPWRKHEVRHGKGDPPVCVWLYKTWQVCAPADEPAFSPVREYASIEPEGKTDEGESVLEPADDPLPGLCFRELSRTTILRIIASSPLVKH